MAEIDTAESYDGDFTLRLEFRGLPRRGINSGLHPRDKAFAHQLQIRDYPRVGLVQARSRATGKARDWNAIEVVVTGTRARCTCNGEPLDGGPGSPRATGPSRCNPRSTWSNTGTSGPGGTTRDSKSWLAGHPLRRPRAGAFQERRLDAPRAARREGPGFGRPLDPRRRLADGRQVERPGEAEGVYRQGVRCFRLDQLPAPCRTSRWRRSARRRPWSIRWVHATTSPSTAATRTASS